MTEVWKKIENSDFYSISNMGRLKCEYTQRQTIDHGKSIETRETHIVRIWDDYAKGGGSRKYCYHSIPNNDGTETNWAIHRLVATYFVPNPDNKEEVDHIDGNPLNNCADNLRWVTHEENMGYYSTKKRKVEKRVTTEIMVDGEWVSEKNPVGRPVGYKCSDETRTKMAERKLGRHQSEEHRQNMAEAQTGMKIVTLPDGSRHRVKVNSFEELMGLAQEKNWWVTEKELRGIWKLLGGE